MPRAKLLVAGLKTSPTPQLQEYPTWAPLNRLGLNVSWPLERITCSLALHSSPQAVPFKGGRGTTRVVVVGRRPLAGFVSLLAYWDAYSTQRFPGGPRGGGDNDGRQCPHAPQLQHAKTSSRKVPVLPFLSGTRRVRSLLMSQTAVCGFLLPEPHALPASQTLPAYRIVSDSVL